MGIGHKWTKNSTMFQVNIGSDNGLVPHSWQAISWIIDEYTGQLAKMKAFLAGTLYKMYLWLFDMVIRTTMCITNARLWDTAACLQGECADVTVAQTSSI